jgi:isoamylase
VSRAVLPGSSYPLGATVAPEGVNFSVHSEATEGLELLLFDQPDSEGPSEVIALDPEGHRDSYYWHVFVPGLGEAALYGFRAHGPWDPARGLRFDPGKVLLDPYGRVTAVGSRYQRSAASRPGDNAGACMKSVVADPSRYDWEGDEPLRRPFARSVIYEMHVGGFTRHPSCGLPPGLRGTYRGLVERIPYLVDLGVTAVELLPVFQFDAQDAPPGLVNYWGYSPVGFFAPHAAYSSRRDPLGPLDEFRDMVKALHRAGIEVILDVVFTHTTEGDEGGPTLSFRGLANETYYQLSGPERRYADYTGCGNTLNANHSIVRRLILDSLRYWVSVMHVDGFRFDLAAILSRDESGRPMENPPVVWSIDSDPCLDGTKMIAEAWDAAGLYEVGSFRGQHWKEWNGRFRDDVRAFWKGDPGAVPRMASRLLASPDVFGDQAREPERSINFVTCHDGFTLNDLVSYDRKHNEANGENSRDGSDWNLSWNCGVEGPTDDPVVEALRARQVKNFLATTLLALGAPMLLMGDEMRRTQGGNNNAWCHDDETSWLDWSLLERHRDLHEFLRRLIHLRLHLDVERKRGLSLREVLEQAEIRWHGVRLGEPDWSDDSHSLAFHTRSPERYRVFHTMLNAYWEPLEFQVPAAPDGGNSWRRIVDTACAAPCDCCAEEQAPPLAGSHCRVEARSLVVLTSPLGRPPSEGS